MGGVTPKGRFWEGNWLVDRGYEDPTVNVVFSTLFGLWGPSNSQLLEEVVDTIGFDEILTTLDLLDRLQSF